MNMRYNYAFAAVVLVFGGAFARTAILNWISGPLVVIVSVAIPTRLGRRRMRNAE